MYLVADVLEEIFLRLPLKSILKFRTVSRKWRSILESRRFAERRRLMNVKKKPKIMAAGSQNRIWGRFQGDEEVEMVYLQCDVSSRPSLSCDGLVCIPVPGWVNVLNPSTGEFLRFPSGPDPVTTDHANAILDSFFDVFPGYWTLGFGRDNISGSYKIVRMCFDPDHYSEILDVNVGKWRKLSPPPYKMGYRKNSACVNGSIFYWSQEVSVYKLLALDLHTEEWRDVKMPSEAVNSTTACQVVNLENRLALASTYPGNNHWNVKIWGMDAREETWSIIYSFPFFPPVDNLIQQFLHVWYWTRPVAVSKQGNLFFHDNENRLFKYYPGSDEVGCIARNIRVISPFVEDLVPLGRLVSITKIRTYGFQYIHHVPSRRISDYFGRIDDMAEIMLTTAAIVTLGMFCFQSVWSRS